MSRADFTEYESADTNHELDSTYKAEGSTSIKINEMGTRSAEILTISETDNPTDVTFQGYNRPSVPNGFGFYFNWGDVDNWYWAGLFEHGAGDTTVKFQLYESDAGAVSRVDQYDTNKGSFFANLSDGNEAQNDWEPIKVEVWVDSGDDLRVKATEDADGDGTWSRYYGAEDLVDTNPSRTSGGMGFGGLNNPNYQNSSKPFWLDAGSDFEFTFEY